ncbi:response regulator [Peribacillus frigoritolerans]
MGDQLEGFQTIGIASSYDEAKSFIEIMQPDLLLLDMYFPDMNGLDILKEIKQQSKQNGCHHDNGG